MKAQHVGALTPRASSGKTRRFSHSSTSGLSPREQLESQVKLHSFTQDEALLSCPNSSGTLQLESEMERNPEVPASTREEALFH